VAWLKTMHAELIAEIGSAEAFASSASGWLDGVLTEVFPSLRQGLRDRPVTKAPPAARQDTAKPWGEPGHVLGRLRVHRDHPAFKGREALYSDRAWQRALTGLADHPWTVSVEIRELDDHGFPAHKGWTGIEVTRDYYAPTWVTFSFSAPAADTGWPESPQLQDEWAHFVQREAGRVNACAGKMTDDVGAGQTALQRATHNMSPKIEDSRSVLRGYSWVTVVTADLVARLGGAEQIESTGAFYQVSPLPNGALWLRATPTINEFTDEKVRAVFEALAPVLLTGEAKYFAPSESYRIVSGVDASDYQPGFSS
jgi:hypothetical protein